MKFSLFKNNQSDKPDGSLTLEQFINLIRAGQWKKEIQTLRANKEGKFYKRIKGRLPAVTISGDFKTRDKHLDLSKRLKAHSGLIALDIDKKDNPKMRASDLVDRDCVAQFVSPGGEGIKIIYCCLPVSTAEEHRRIFDALIHKLEQKGVTLKVDPIVKSIASFQYVSYDPDAHYFPDTKYIAKPLPPIQNKPRAALTDTGKELDRLNEYIEALGKKDVTAEYENWLLILFGLSYSLGEAGREPFQRISRNYPGYSEKECDEKFDTVLEQDRTAIDKPVTIASVYQIILEALPKQKAKQLLKKYAAHVIGQGEDVEQGELIGMVRYKLFLFKKIIDKETNTVVELSPTKLNLNAFEKLLRAENFYRHENFGYVHIQNNIVETIDLPDILRILTAKIESEGDYIFSYKEVEYRFSWEEIAHRWREIRAGSSIGPQVAASLPHWEPNLLRDTATESFIPYQNGILRIDAKGFKLVPYNALPYQIWKDKILPREFRPVKEIGMFEKFFANVMGRGETQKARTSSPQYKRSLWYFGYALQGTKRQSTARAWLLYDIKPGNNGRTGKTIIGTALGKIRNVTVIDGKQVDLTNRFAFQTVEPWTDIVFIDDPAKYMSLVPLFNMITGQTIADKKGKAPIVKDFKFVIASNWILEAEGQSETGRQFVSQLDDFYVRYSKEHSDTITPIVDLHGKEFFTDWDAKDWAQFDTFAAKAVQYYLSAAAPENTIIGNSAIMRFIQLHEEELFFELSVALRQYARPTEAGGFAIPQQVLTSIIRDNNEGLKANKAGRIAREFLGVIGAGTINISTVRAGNSTRMAYFSGTPLKNLTFGEPKKRAK